MLHIIPIEEKTGGTDMNILFYDTKRYDMESFDAIKDQYDKLTIDYVDTDLSVKTARLAKGYDAICAFVSSDVSAPVVNALSDAGVKLILMRCAGFNNVDMDGTCHGGEQETAQELYKGEGEQLQSGRTYRHELLRQDSRYRRNR